MIRNFFRRRINIQYISDVHVDVSKGRINIKPMAPYLAICGDIGDVRSPYFKSFLKNQSQNFDKVLFVSGNHEYDLGCVYDVSKVNKYEPIVRDICDQFPNVHYLNQQTFELSPNVLVAGCTLWSRPLIRDSIYDYLGSDHLIKLAKNNQEHLNQVNWIKKVIMDTEIKNNVHNKSIEILMLTHFVPTLRLIEPKYKLLGNEKVSYFATDLEYLMKDPIKVWLSGHSHSVIDCDINGVKCAINAHGYSRSQMDGLTKIITM